MTVKQDKTLKDSAEPKTVSKKASTTKVSKTKAASTKSTSAAPTKTATSSRDEKATTPMTATAAGAAARAQSGLSYQSAELRGRARDRAYGALDGGKARTSNFADSVSRMIEDSAPSIDRNVGAKYGDYARSAATSVSDFGRRVEEKDIDELVEDAKEFVRTKPAMAVGIAAVGAFMLTRLFKSSGDE